MSDNDKRIIRNTLGISIFTLIFVLCLIIITLLLPIKADAYTDQSTYNFGETVTLQDDYTFYYYTHIFIEKDGSAFCDWIPPTHDQDPYYWDLADECSTTLPVGSYEYWIKNRDSLETIYENDTFEVVSEGGGGSTSTASTTGNYNGPSFQEWLFVMCVIIFMLSIRVWGIFTRFIKNIRERQW